MARPRVEGKREQFVGSAISYVDEHDLDSLTLRVLGERLGMHSTAMYRHFKDKDDLVIAMLDKITGEAVDAVDIDNPDPRARLIDLALSVRKTFGKHSNLALAAVTSSGIALNLGRLSLLVLQALEDLGVSGRRLPVAYQALESYVMGSTVYDFGRAPDHLEIRRTRRASLAHPTIDAHSRSSRDIHRTNEDAFLLGLEAIVDTAVQ